ncbi:TetR/AcrR family transcriptional regulator [Pseudonocardia sp. WMMC193]|uniref:TetR/AcrR family transcriptional regulator n=1 Tax=Pseudonocardia sp. WMMC193 TaxID=2911965 RepID=UPI001F17EF0D|nr:TetR/AcrR family transcriptional regulator [Pseudonocardia sp. WMMC193]MCF7548730.1 TetR/AcrR family transcriptional regulator [Pseudonocardia sp. WMMC193]
MDVRRRILDAAVEVLAAAGFEAASLSEVAARAGVSRPTVYRHFGTREQLVSAALLRLSGEVVERIWATANAAGSPAEVVVEATLRARYEFRTQPALAPVAFPERSTFALARASMSTEAIAMTKRFLAPLLDHRPELADEMDEIAETVIRFLLSLVWFDGAAGADEDALRGYLHRRLVPALGLAPARRESGVG